MKEMKKSEEYKRASENLKKIRKRIEPFTTKKRLKIRSAEQQWRSGMA